MTLEDIAKRLNVSRATVSRALNPTTEHLISESVRKKIKAYAADAHFLPNRSAQELVRGRSYTIGAILSTSFNSIFYNDHLIKIQAGLHAVLEDHGRYTSKVVILPRGKPLSLGDQQGIGTRADGILVAALCDPAAYTMQDLLKDIHLRWKCPVVALHLDRTPIPAISTVNFNNQEAAHLGVTYLIQKGHERIGLIFSDNGAEDALERVKGFKSALRAHRLPYDPAWVAQGDFTAPSGYQSALKILQSKKKAVSALFCTNDEMAVGAMKAIKALRLNCPRDIAVMGFDGLSMGEFTDPRLSTVAQPSQEIARAGAQLLFDLVEERQKGPIHLRVKATLQIRDSA